MEKKIMTVALIGACFVLPTFPAHHAFADEETDTAENKPFFEGRYNWECEENERDTIADVKKLNHEAPAPKNQGSGYTPKLASEGNFKDKLIAEIPYGEDIKYMWDVVDGDVDLHITGLRADRRNKGVSYVTNTIPFVGDVEGLELKFKAGKNNELSFKSSTTPFIGKVDGLSYVGATGNDGSKIFARYTIAFD